MREVPPVYVCTTACVAFIEFAQCDEMLSNYCRFFCQNGAELLLRC
jgi:hypothetical protein